MDKLILSYYHIFNDYPKAKLSVIILNEHYMEMDYILYVIYIFYIINFHFDQYLICNSS
jgi:hypothetical protein